MCVCVWFIIFLVRNILSYRYTARKRIFLQLICFIETARVNGGPYMSRQWTFEPDACFHSSFMIFDGSLEFYLHT